MTITPLPVLPASHGTRGTSTDSPAGQAGQASTAETFAALLDGQLAASTAVPPEPEGEAAEDQSLDTASSSAENLLAGSVGVSAAPVLPAGTPLPSGVATAQSAASAAVASVDAPAQQPSVADPLVGPSSVGPAANAADPQTVTRQPPVETVAPAAGDAGTAMAAPALTGPQQGDDTSGPARPVASEKVADAPSTTPTASAAAPTVPATTTEGAAGTEPARPASSPVLAQVAPVLSRVVTRGDGEHRMMLRLHPADLGEVHLTVTVRGDHVDVEIAAGAEAREVLREGSAQLRSLLESIGRSTGQLVLRDLPVSPASAAGSGTGGPGADGGPPASYADTGDGSRGRHDHEGGRHRPRLADQPLDRPVVTPRASGRTTVPGGPALDVTV